MSVLQRSGWQPTEVYLRPFRNAVKYFEDCLEPGKPIYHSLLKLASKLPGFTGLVNSTPVESWTEEQRIKKWRSLQKRAESELLRAVTGMTKAERKKAARVTTKARAAGSGCVTTKAAYTHYQPHPRKYRSNAERQRAYRERMSLQK